MECVRGALVLLGVLAHANRAEEVACQPQSDTSTIELWCGHELKRHGSGRDARARDCFFQAYTGGLTALFATTFYTIEGDAITFILRTAAGRVEVFEDSKDRFGRRGRFRYSCRMIEREQPQPNWEEPAKLRGFILKQCTGRDKDLYIR